MRIDITASCRSRALRSSWPMPENRRSNSTGSSDDAVCASIDWVITSSPTRLMIWSTFSVGTRIDPESGACAAAAAAGLAAAFSLAAGAAAGAAATGAGAGAGAATGAGAACGAAGAWPAATASTAICFSSMTKQQTAMMSSVLHWLFSQMVRSPSASSWPVISPRLASSSRSSAWSPADTLIRRTFRLPPADAATGAGAGAATGAGAGAGACAVAPPASCASCCSTAQMRANVSGSGSVPLR